jgi:hypothetical protein
MAFSSLDLQEGSGTEGSTEKQIRPSACQAVWRHIHALPHKISTSLVLCIFWLSQKLSPNNVGVVMGCVVCVCECVVWVGVVYGTDV